MAIRIRELSPELGVENKEIIAFLADKGVVKTASSNIDDDQAAMVRKHFAKKPEKKAEDKPKAVKQDAPKAAFVTAEPKNEAKPKVKTEAKPEAKPADAVVKKPKSKIQMSGSAVNKNISSNRVSIAGDRVRKNDRPQQPQKSSVSSQNVRDIFNKSLGISTPAPKKSVAKPEVKPEGNVKSGDGAKSVQPVKSEVFVKHAEEVKPAEPKKPEVKGAQVVKPEETAPVKAKEESKAVQEAKAGQGAKDKGAEAAKSEQKPKSAVDIRAIMQDRGNDKKAAKPQDKPRENKEPEKKPVDNKTQNKPSGITRISDPAPQIKIIRHETPRTESPKPNIHTNERGRAQGGRFNAGGTREGSQKSSISFSSNSPYNRGGDSRSQGPGRNGGKADRSKASNKTFIAGPGAKEQQKGRDRRKGDRRKDIERDEEQIKSKKFNPHGFHKPEKVQEEEEKIKVITLPEKITIRDLADRMKIQPAQILKKMLLEGKMATLNSELSYEDAENIAIEYDIICEMEEKVDVIAELLKEEEEDDKLLKKRPPVVCVMGHVDHGKTSLLDAIRHANVTDREAGGITQHIGAYTVDINGNAITFLDTPGHEAFTAMRMRGANSTDIAILVVAADDGVMPQTVEAINHAKAAGIEIIVAVNKIDKPNANIDRVKQELSEYELIPEDWGGSTVFAPVSAKTGQGIKELLEMVTLTADILELKANPKRKARGLVIEAQLDKGRGPVATVLVQKGTLKIGDFIAAGATHGKVRAMLDDKGNRVKEAGPSIPVEILGLNDVPNAGEVFICHANDKDAKHFADTFIEQNRLKLLEDTKLRMSLDDVFSQIKEGNLKELNIIVKADVQGSVEAVKTSLLKLSNEEVVVKVIHSGVGAINESDVILASASNAIIIGFNVRPDATAKNTAESEGVDVRLYKVIYQAIEDVEAAMKGMLDPVYEEKVLGHAEVRQIFKASGVGNIAGAYVLDGTFERGCKVRISRQGEQIFEGDLASLKRFKDDVKEVKAGFECGLVFEGFGEMEELDIVEAYKMVEVPR